MITSPAAAAAAAGDGCGSSEVTVALQFVIPSDAAGEDAQDRCQLLLRLRVTTA